jgi:hypothetical protein
VVIGVYKMHQLDCSDIWSNAIVAMAVNVMFFSDVVNIYINWPLVKEVILYNLGRCQIQWKSLERGHWKKNEFHLLTAAEKYCLLQALESRP